MTNLHRLGYADHQALMMHLIALHRRTGGKSDMIKTEVGVRVGDGDGVEDVNGGNPPPKKSGRRQRFEDQNMLSRLAHQSARIPSKQKESTEKAND